MHQNSRRAEIVTKHCGAQATTQRLIISAIKKYGALSSRLLERYTGIERCSITRQLNKMELPKPPARPVLKSSTGFCPLTNMPVKYYQLIKP
jgi:hypothetical protein